MNPLQALMPAHQDLHDLVVQHLISEREDYGGEQLAPARSSEGVARLVVWRNAAFELPDDECSVLVFVPEDSEPVWIGFHEEGKWRSPCGMPLSFPVTHWAHLPEPPIRDAR